MTDLNEKDLALARKLAANEKPIRDKTVKILAKWLKVRADMSDLDYLKIWKALYYCMWMSDKPLIQQELAETLARLVHVLPPKQGMRFIRGFFITMCREWIGIDHHRLDKYYMFIRHILNQAIEYLHSHGWDSELILQWENLLMETVFDMTNTKVPDSLRYYVTEKYIEISQRFSSQQLPMELLNPFFEILTHCTNKVLIFRVREQIFEKILAGRSKSNSAYSNEIANIRDHLFSLAAHPDTLQKNRDVIYGIIRKYSAAVGDEPHLPESRKRKSQDDDTESRPKQKKSQEKESSDDEEGEEEEFSHLLDDCMEEEMDCCSRDDCCKVNNRDNDCMSECKSFEKTNGCCDGGECEAENSSCSDEECLGCEGENHGCCDDVAAMPPSMVWEIDDTQKDLMGNGNSHSLPLSSSVWIVSPTAEQRKLKSPIEKSSPKSPTHSRMVENKKDASLAKAADKSVKIKMLGQKSPILRKSIGSRNSNEDYSPDEDMKKVRFSLDKNEILEFMKALPVTSVSASKNKTPTKITKGT